jgi:hypothetical protein
VGWRAYCWVGLVTYALLSVVDFRFTSALLRANGGAYESNPVAAACLEQHGWRGLALYKAAGVVAFTGSLILLIRHRPKAGAGVVTFGCLVLLSVTTYSHGLLRDSHRENAELGLTAEQFELFTGPQSDLDFELSNARWHSTR